MQEPNQHTLRSPRIVDYVRLLSISAIWGTSFLCIEIALRDFSPIGIATYRIVIAAILLCLVCWWSGITPRLQRRTLYWLFVIGVLNSVVPFTLIGWGQLSVDSATTGILLATSPFATLLFSHFMTGDDGFSRFKLFGLLLGFSGVLVLLGRGFSAGDNALYGMLAVVLAACCYSLSAVLIRKLSGIPSLVLAAGTLVAGAMVLTPLLFWSSPPWQQAYGRDSLSALLFLAIGPTAICYVLRAQIVNLNGAVFMSNVGYLIPVFALIWSWVFLAQPPTVSMLLALALILCGIAMGQRTQPLRAKGKR